MRTTTLVLCLFVGTPIGVLLTAAVLDSNYSSPFKEIALVLAAAAIGIPPLIAMVVYDRRDRP